jgi:hypothetical protein
MGILGVSSIFPYKCGGGNLKPSLGVVNFSKQ